MAIDPHIVTHMVTHIVTHLDRAPAGMLTSATGAGWLPEHLP
jgi:hypothetical protein